MVGAVTVPPVAVPNVTAQLRPVGRKMVEQAKSVHNITGLPTRGTVFSHRNTVGNVLWTVRERVLYTIVDGELTETLRPAGRFATPSMVAWRNRVIRELGTNSSPITHEEFCAKYGGMKRKRYERAAVNLRTQPRNPRASAVMGFLKPEKWLEHKAPRLISPRSPEYLLESGCYLEPLEKKMYRAIASANRYECVMKGYNLRDRASVMRQHWDSFERPVAVGLDASKFDQHVSVQALQYEHSFYLKTYRNDPLLRSILGQQLLNRVKCFCEDGIVSWTSQGGRMSGDMNTALGNCILSAGMLSSWAEEIGVRIKTVVDGDDCVAFMESRDLGRFLEGIIPWYAARGFRMKIEPACYEFEDIEFCQCHPVFTGEYWILVRNPIKAITQDHAWIERGGITHEEVLSATGEGGYQLYQDIPVLASYYKMLRGSKKLSKRAKSYLHTSKDWLRHLNSDKYSVLGQITDECRLSFYKAFGISPAHQRMLEEYFSKFNLRGALADMQYKDEIHDNFYVSNLLHFNTPTFCHF